MHYYKHKFALPARQDRLIFVQTEDEAKGAHQTIEVIKKRWSPPKFFYHLRRGGHVSALRLHKHDRYFSSADIENFFPSITRNKIQRALKAIGFSLPDAQLIAHRSCVMEGGRRFLPFGYVQSPLLASLVLDKSALGHEIREIRKSDVNISVFMDDIITSHPTDTDRLDWARARLEAAAAKSNFVFSAKKRQGPSEKITAFNVDLQHEQLNVTPNKFEEFSQRVLQQGMSKSTEGILGYVRAINDAQLDQLSKLLHP